MSWFRWFSKAKKCSFLAFVNFFFLLLTLLFSCFSL
jgi:hypothetical protein